MRRSRGRCLSAVAVAVSIAVSGCGKSNPVSQTAVDSVTRASAVSYAGFVNLRPGDLAWERLKPGGVTHVSYATYKLFRCEGRSANVAVFSSHSGTYGSRGAGSMQSGVAVLPTPALAATDTRAALSDRAFACTKRALAPPTMRLPNGRTFDRGPGRLRRLAGLLPGVSGDYRWRETWTHHSSDGIASHVFLDYLGFVVGPSEVVLQVRSLGKPLPDATELQALRALYRRARARQP
ncbi:MAG TPA: hypothetical protein VH025_00365 [Solirubrobacteraceae bacterium]|jgi:hypothetical protein|nr:hypothetical protein [Solirubrobacteraceae bacterium]